MIVEIETRLACSPQQVIDEVKKTKLLAYVARPLLKFVPIEPSEFPVLWEVGQYKTSLRLFGVIPLGYQILDASFPQSESLYCMRDNGYSALIKTWDHTITIDALGDETLYKDRVVVDAGLLTPFVWMFVWFFFRHRQRRWRKLVSRQFQTE